MTVDDDELIADEASSGVGIALIILLAAILLMLMFLFRAELGIPIPDISIAQPDGIPQGAESVNDRLPPPDPVAVEAATELEELGAEAEREAMELSSER